MEETKNLLSLHFLPEQPEQTALRSQGFHERDDAPYDFASVGPLTPCPIKKEMQFLKGFMMMKKEDRRAASLGAPVACRMMEDHRNRFIRFRLYSGMRFLLGFLVLMTAQAMSLKDFNAQPGKDQAAYVSTFIDRMTTDLRAKNPELAASIRDWFAVKQPGKPLSEGMERLGVELGALDRQDKDGKADLSKIQLESVIVYLVKQKFPPKGAYIPPQVVTPFVGSSFTLPGV